MVVNNPVVAGEDEEEILGPNIWSKEEEDDDEAATTFFLSMPKLSRWICMYVSFKGVLLLEDKSQKGLGMPKRERIRFAERGEETREHVMSKREHVKICSCFVILSLTVVYAYI